MPEDNEESWVELTTLSAKSDAFLSVEELKADLSSALEELPNATAVRGQSLSTSFYTTGDTQNPNFQQLEESFLSTPPSRVSRRYAPIKEGEFNAIRPPDPMFINAAKPNQAEGDRPVYPESTPRPDSLEALEMQKQASAPRVETSSSLLTSGDEDMPHDPRALAFAQMRGVKTGQERKAASYSLENAVAGDSSANGAENASAERPVMRSQGSTPIFEERASAPKTPLTEVAAPGLDADIPKSLQAVLDKRRTETQQASKKETKPSLAPTPRKKSSATAMDAVAGVDVEGLIGPSSFRAQSKNAPSVASQDSDLKVTESQTLTESASSQDVFPATDAEDSPADVKKKFEDPVSVDSPAFDVFNLEVQENGAFNADVKENGAFNAEGVDAGNFLNAETGGVLDAEGVDAGYALNAEVGEIGVLGQVASDVVVAPVEPDSASYESAAAYSPREVDDFFNQALEQLGQEESTLEETQSEQFVAGVFQTQEPASDGAFLFEELADATREANAPGMGDGVSSGNSEILVADVFGAAADSKGSAEAADSQDARELFAISGSQSSIENSLNFVSQIDQAVEDASDRQALGVPDLDGTDASSFLSEDMALSSLSDFTAYEESEAARESTDNPSGDEGFDADDEYDTNDQNAVIEEEGLPTPVLEGDDLEDADISLPVEMEGLSAETYAEEPLSTNTSPSIRAETQDLLDAGTESVVVGEDVDPIAADGSALPIAADTAPASQADAQPWAEDIQPDAVEQAVRAETDSASLGEPDIRPIQTDAASQTETASVESPPEASQEGEPAVSFTDLNATANESDLPNVSRQNVSVPLGDNPSSVVPEDEAEIATSGVEELPLQTAFITMPGATGPEEVYSPSDLLDVPITSVVRSGYEDSPFPAAPVVSDEAAAASQNASSEGPLRTPNTVTPGKASEKTDARKASEKTDAVASSGSSGQVFGAPDEPGQQGIEQRPAADVTDVTQLRPGSFNAADSSEAGIQTSFSEGAAPQVSASYSPEIDRASPDAREAAPARSEAPALPDGEAPQAYQQAASTGPAISAAASDQTPQQRATNLEDTFTASGSADLLEGIHTEDLAPDSAILAQGAGETVQNETVQNEAEGTQAAVQQDEGIVSTESGLTAGAFEDGWPTEHTLSTTVERKASASSDTVEPAEERQWAEDVPENLSDRASSGYDTPAVPSQEPLESPAERAVAINAPEMDSTESGSGSRFAASEAEIKTASTRAQDVSYSETLAADLSQGISPDVSERPGISEQALRTDAAAAPTRLDDPSRDRSSNEQTGDASPSGYGDKNTPGAQSGQENGQRRPQSVFRTIVDSVGRVFGRPSDGSRDGAKPGSTSGEASGRTSGSKGDPSSTTSADGGYIAAPPQERATKLPLSGASSPVDRVSAADKKSSAENIEPTKQANDIDGIGSASAKENVSPGFSAEQAARSESSLAGREDEQNGSFTPTKSEPPVRMEPEAPGSEPAQQGAEAEIALGFMPENQAPQGKAISDPVDENQYAGDYQIVSEDLNLAEGSTIDESNIGTSFNISKSIDGVSSSENTGRFFEESSVRINADLAAQNVEDSAFVTSEAYSDKTDISENPTASEDVVSVYDSGKEKNTDTDEASYISSAAIQSQNGSYDEISLATSFVENKAAVQSPNDNSIGIRGSSKEAEPASVISQVETDALSSSNSNPEFVTSTIISSTAEGSSSSGNSPIVPEAINLPRSDAAPLDAGSPPPFVSSQDTKTPLQVEASKALASPDAEDDASTSVIVAAAAEADASIVESTLVTTAAYSQDRVSASGDEPGIRAVTDVGAEEARSLSSDLDPVLSAQTASSSQTVPSQDAGVFSQAVNVSSADSAGATITDLVSKVDATDIAESALVTSSVPDLDRVPSAVDESGVVSTTVSIPVEEGRITSEGGPISSAENSILLEQTPQPVSSQGTGLSGQAADNAVPSAPDVAGVTSAVLVSPAADETGANIAESALVTSPAPSQDRVPSPDNESGIVSTTVSIPAEEGRISSEEGLISSAEESILPAQRSNQPFLSNQPASPQGAVLPARDADSASPSSPEPAGGDTSTVLASPAGVEAGADIAESTLVTSSVPGQDRAPSPVGEPEVVSTTVSIPAEEGLITSSEESIPPASPLLSAQPASLQGTAPPVQAAENAASSSSDSAGLTSPGLASTVDANDIAESALVTSSARGQDRVPSPDNESGIVTTNSSRLDEERLIFSAEESIPLLPSASPLLSPQPASPRETDQPTRVADSAFPSSSDTTGGGTSTVLVSSTGAETGADIVESTLVTSSTPSQDRVPSSGDEPGIVTTSSSRPTDQNRISSAKEPIPPAQPLPSAQSVSPQGTGMPGQAADNAVSSTPDVAGAASAVLVSAAGAGAEAGADIVESTLVTSSTPSQDRVPSSGDELGIVAASSSRLTDEGQISSAKEPIPPAQPLPSAQPVSPQGAVAPARAADGIAPFSSGTTGGDTNTVLASSTGAETGAGITESTLVTSSAPDQDRVSSPGNESAIGAMSSFRSAEEGLISSVENPTLPAQRSTQLLLSNQPDSPQGAVPPVQAVDSTAFSLSEAAEVASIVLASPTGSDSGAEIAESMLVTSSVFTQDRASSPGNESGIVVTSASRPAEESRIPSEESLISSVENPILPGQTPQPVSPRGTALPGQPAENTVSSAPDTAETDSSTVAVYARGVETGANTAESTLVTSSVPSQDRVSSPGNEAGIVSTTVSIPAEEGRISSEEGLISSAEESILPAQRSNQPFLSNQPASPQGAVLPARDADSASSSSPDTTVGDMSRVLASPAGVAAGADVAESTLVTSSLPSKDRVPSPGNESGIVATAELKSNFGDIESTAFPSVVQSFDKKQQAEVSLKTYSDRNGESYDNNTNEYLEDFRLADSVQVAIIKETTYSEGTLSPASAMSDAFTLSNKADSVSQQQSDTQAKDSKLQRKRLTPSEQPIRTETVYKKEFLDEVILEKRSSRSESAFGQDRAAEYGAQVEEKSDAAALSAEQRLEVMIRRERIRLEGEINTKEDNQKIALRRAENRIRETVNKELPPRVSRNETQSNTKKSFDSSPRSQSEELTGRTQRFQQEGRQNAEPGRRIRYNNSDVSPPKAPSAKPQAPVDPKEQFVTIREIENLQEQQQLDEAVLRQQIKRELRLETENKIIKNNAEQELKMKRKMRNMIEKFLDS